MAGRIPVPFTAVFPVTDTNVHRSFVKKELVMQFSEFKNNLLFISFSLPLGQLNFYHSE